MVFLDTGRLRNAGRDTETDRGRQTGRDVTGKDIQTELTVIAQHGMKAISWNNFRSFLR